MEVDRVDSTLAITDSISGEPVSADVFASCLSYSMYSYAEAFSDIKSPVESRCTSMRTATVEVSPGSLRLKMQRLWSLRTPAWSYSY